MIWSASGSTNDSPEYFSWDLIRKYIVVFGHTFDSITIQRIQANNTTQIFKVPLQYAPKDKMMVRLASDPDLDRPYSALLPMISFEITGFQYRPADKIPALNKNVVINTANNNTLNIQYAPVPYDILLNLYVYVKNMSDLTQIIEQILPFFQPDFTPQVELIPSMGEIRDIPIVLGTPNYSDLYDGDFKNRRVLTVTLPFKMKAYFFGPVRSKPIIKFITLNQRVGSQYIQLGSTTLNVAVNSSITTFNLTAPLSIPLGDKASNNYYGLIDNELVYITSGIGTSNLVVQRAQSNTIANAHYAGSTFTLEIEPGVAEYVSIQPGMTNTGIPTSNSSLSVNASLINIDNDYGFITTINSGDAT